MLLSDKVRCDICGLAVPLCDKVRVSIWAYTKSDTDIPQPRLNVCPKCLPNLMIMFDLAIIKTSRAMVAANSEIRGKYTPTVPANVDEKWDTTI